MEKRGQKARLAVSPMEQEYVRRYGKLPDYDYNDFWGRFGSVSAGKIVQERMDGIWQDMKDSQNPTFRSTDSNPFQKSDYQTGKEYIQ